MEADNQHSSNITSGTNGLGDKLGSVWNSRITEGNKHYDKWSQKNKCDKMEEYYCGNQWEPTGTNYEPYVINLVFSTIQIQLPSLLFDSPIYHIKPRPAVGEYDLETAAQRAQLREDVLNTIISDPVVDLGHAAELAILDSFFRFGIIEVGYAANWILNPNADMPILRSDSTPYTDGKGNSIRQPFELPDAERIYVKQIDAKRFRVGGLEGSKLESCSWCGYWEFQRVEDLKANKELKNLDRLVWSGARSQDFVPEEYGPEIDSLTRTGDLVKVWKIWDLRKKKLMIFADPQWITLLEKPFKRLPIFDLRPNKLLRGWYPLPPVKNWKPAQDEINDSHEQMRNHRKRFTRKFLYDKSKMQDEEEQDKLINGGDGTFAAVVGDIDKAVKPVENADLGAQEGQSLVVTKDDFNIISGTSSDQRGAQDKQTATAATITNQFAQVNASRRRNQIAKWLARIGREIILLAEEKYTTPIWIKIPLPAGTVDQFGNEQANIWKQVQLSDFGTQELGEDFKSDFDFEVNITLDSLSPITNDDDQKKFLLFLGALNQYPELSESPDLVFELAYRIGYRNTKIIRQLQQVAKIRLQIQLAQLGIQSGQGQQQPQLPLQSQMAQGQVAQNTPPDLQQINNQLRNQVQ